MTVVREDEARPVRGDERGPGAVAAGQPVGFKPHLRVEHIPGEAVYVFSERRATALHGAPVARIAPLLDGTRTLREVVREAPGGAPGAPGPAAEQTARIVSRLIDAGLVGRRPLTAPGARAAAAQAYWEAVGLDGPAAEEALAAATVGTLAVGSGDTAELRGALRAAGLRPAEDGQDGAAELTVVLCDDYLTPALAAVDAEHRAAGRRWLPVKSTGAEQWIGPFFGDPEGPCWSCLADRLWRTRPVEAHVRRALGSPGPVPRPACALPAARLAALQLAALEAAKWLAGHRHPGQGQLWTLGGLGEGTAGHPVVRRPQCPDCGTPELIGEQVRAPLTLVSRPKTDVSGGGHRTLTPQQFLDRHGHHLDPVTGLVSEVRRDRHGPAFLNSFHAGLNPSATPYGTPGAPGLATVRAGLRAACGGKGTTELQARVSALAEALERHSGFLQGGEAQRRGSYREFADEAVHPDAVQLYDPRQFTDRARWNAAHGPLHQVCDPFDEDAAIDWTPVWSLTEHRHKLLPTALLYYNAPQEPGRRYCLAGSNGSAAGGSLEDAVLQGVFELVERDAVALWWYNRTRHPGVDLSALGDDWTRQLIHVHRDLNREVWALDLTTDLGIPVMAALSRRTDKPAEDIMLGFGAHFDPRIALRRALTELNQMLPHVVGARPDGTGYATTDPEVLDWSRTATAADLPYLRPDPAQPVTDADTHAYEPRTDLLDDVMAAREVLRGKGLELLVRDQTRPDVGLPVVKVVVPGLRPHWSRFGPGRLYDVPVRLGRLAEPTRYEDLNPRPLFL
ncbi:TOMM precursor leader peptide-binding protein [Streptomyces sp. BG9H]|uniref:TOMM leader peptide-binding protein n=1 Tax=Streptomyces anatolicus TaxID=2675858 RepID=A0ABS6YRQ7_9ACTN|nr:TOMM precursor leader peptide-binding protein [Streptomyces anatolicus]MBW5424128.1 TOMM precursor leader peptide-binding protein [Streptomyces anatolicus]